MSEHNKIVHIEAAQAILRAHFLGWQCRIRQLSVRKAEGRPSAAMRPKLSVATIPSASAAEDVEITCLIVKSVPEHCTAQWQHIVRKTHDPAQRRADGLKLLAAEYYQKPDSFAEELTALFGPNSSLAGWILAAGSCILEFSQYGQYFKIPCTVKRLAEDHANYQATYWHNHLFNPALPAEVIILQFNPDWAHTHADPLPHGIGERQ